MTTNKVENFFASGSLIQLIATDRITSQKITSI